MISARPERTNEVRESKGQNVILGRELAKHSGSCHSGTALFYLFAGMAVTDPGNYPGDAGDRQLAALLKPLLDGTAFVS